MSSSDRNDHGPRDPNRFHEPSRTTSGEVDFRIGIEHYFAEGIGTNVEKLQNFPKYVPTQDLRRFVSRYELFKQVLDVHGSIVECGVLFGGGLMGWAQFSEIFEPFNHLRNVIGFDTFEGFVNVSEKDRTGTAAQLKTGGLGVDAQADLERAIGLFDQNRVLKHIRKVRLVRGDACKTIPAFIEENPHLVVSLLWLDFDVYEPTVAALRHFLPRMPKGAIIAFDELNHEVWPGETVAVLEEVGLKNLRIRRLPYGSTMSYAVIE
ncbi:TylF/MycF/NovP-related O-methyltransferase [Azospirillum brasilense]|uniref:Class I SAM-dependent methyltransferase n=1 Tax=Azospirillum brasilense TaxID=192 RepID=A0A6L3ASF4_AZOBR|nr:TylF/MycF/NovP-related O-methyltransferase [Azospirillum brasilense]KAA0677908.1 class I SAM-dependent methyltransferase [Azospirillum brasilense]